MAASRTTRKFRKEMRKTRRKGGKRGPPSSSAQTFQLHDSSKYKCNPSKFKYYKDELHKFQKGDNYKKIKKFIENASTEDQSKYAELNKLYKNTKKQKELPLDDIFIDYDEPKTRGKVTCFEGDSPPHKKIPPKRRSSEIDLSKLYGKKGGKKGPSGNTHTFLSLYPNNKTKKYIEHNKSAKSNRTIEQIQSHRKSLGKEFSELRKSSYPSLEEP
jgi:hypothetical protein